MFVIFFTNPAKNYRLTQNEAQNKVTLLYLLCCSISTVLTNAILYPTFNEDKFATVSHEFV